MSKVDETPWAGINQLVQQMDAEENAETGAVSIDPPKTIESNEHSAPSTRAEAPRQQGADRNPKLTLVETGHAESPAAPMQPPSAGPSAASKPEDTLNRLQAVLQGNSDVSAYAPRTRPIAPSSAPAGPALVDSLPQRNHPSEVTAAAHPVPQPVDHGEISDPDAGALDMSDKRLPAFSTLSGIEDMLTNAKAGRLDLFTLRRSIRFLHHRCETHRILDEEMRIEFDTLQEVLAIASVHYRKMRTAFEQHSAQQQQLNQAKAELFDLKKMVVAERKARNNVQAQLNEVNARAAEDREAQLTAIRGYKWRLNSSAEEVAALKTKLSDAEEARNKMAAELDKIRIDRDKKDGHAQLLKAEGDVLREALREACDTIAADMERELGRERQVQQLEERLANAEIEAGEPPQVVEPSSPIDPAIAAAVARTGSADTFDLAEFDELILQDRYAASADVGKKAVEH